MDLDYKTAFDLAPIGLVLSRNRLIVDCNRRLLEMFGTSREALAGRSFEALYPTHDEFERTGARIVARLDKSGYYADERVMKRVGGPKKGELFWCHVSGRALDPKHPHAAGIWSFEDLSSHRAVKQDFTGREREIAALLIEGLTSAVRAAGRCRCRADEALGRVLSRGGGRGLERASQPDEALLRLATALARDTRRIDPTRA